MNGPGGKEIIIQKLKEHGYRLTRQRLILLDIILEDECTCCKEIYYRAAQKNEKIGMATVYRMINTLEEIGAISRKNMYRMACGRERKSDEVHIVEFEDGSSLRLSAEAWNQVVSIGLKECGYMHDRELRGVRTTDKK